jgi:DNA-binding NtrC family response regulator
MTTDPPARPRVLVVDDDADIAYLVSLMLSRIGTFDTETAPTAEQALAMLADGEWDLLLTDLRMPGMDGTELVREAKALRPGLPAIIMTAHTTVDAAVDTLLLGAGAVSFIQKPLGQEELVTLATRAVEQARAERASSVHAAAARPPAGRSQP